MTWLSVCSTISIKSNVTTRVLFKSYLALRLVFLKMHLWSILCCCCKEDTEKYEHMKEDTSGVVKKELSVKKPSFPRIVIQVKLKILRSNLCDASNSFHKECLNFFSIFQEPTPLTLRRDSQIVIVKQPKQQEWDSSFFFLVFRMWNIRPNGQVYEMQFEVQFAYCMLWLTKLTLCYYVIHTQKEYLFLTANMPF